MKQQESTLLDLKASEEGLSGFDFICKTYEEKLKFLCHKLQEKCNGKSLSKHEISLEVLIISGIDRTKVASIIYSIYKNNGKGIGFSEGVKLETVIQSEPEASSSKAKIISKPKNSNPKAMINSDTETSKIKILKRSDPVPQSLLKPESEVLMSKCQKNKTVVASWELKSKGVKPKMLVNQKQPSLQHKVQEVKSKTSNTNPKGPIKQWVPKPKLVSTADMPKSKGKAKIVVPKLRLLKTYDRREFYVPHPHNERRSKCEVWRQPV